MKYFLDTEFIEGTQKKWFGKSIKPTIDLISIGIVDEAGREFYEVSKEFNLKEAWNRFQWKDFKSTHGETLEQKEYWIRDNVLKPIWEKLSGKYLHTNMLPDEHHSFSYSSLKVLLKEYGKTNKEIAEEVKQFCSSSLVFHRDIKVPDKMRNYYVGTILRGGNPNEHENVYNNVPIEFYGYYADYDWVVFCWLFGHMIDLPKGFPMYCKDLKQISDEVYEERKKSYYSNDKSKIKERIGYFISSLSKHPDYPKQANEHNALADAKWNKRLYNFLMKVKLP